jgi:hypothetical protein
MLTEIHLCGLARPPSKKKHRVVKSLNEKQSLCDRIQFRNAPSFYCRLPTYLGDALEDNKLNRRPRLHLRWREAFPILTNKGATAETAGHYLHQAFGRTKNLLCPEALAPEVVMILTELLPPSSTLATF